MKGFSWFHFNNRSRRVRTAQIGNCKEPREQEAAEGCRVDFQSQLQKADPEKPQCSIESVQNWPLRLSIHLEKISAFENFDNILDS